MIPTITIPIELSKVERLKRGPTHARDHEAYDGVVSVYVIVNGELEAAYHADDAYHEGGPTGFRIERL